MQHTQCILQNIRSLATEARYSEIWGTDLNGGEPRVVEAVIQMVCIEGHSRDEVTRVTQTKLLKHHSIIPSL